MSIRESAIERKSMAWATSQGALVLKVQGAKGWPDRLVLKPSGKVMFVEFKRPGQEPNALQAHMLQEIRRRGVLAYWVQSFADFVKAYEQEY